MCESGGAKQTVQVVGNNREGNGNGNEPGDETNQLETRQKSERRKKYSQ